ncbi:Prolyl-tRNA synthetase associated domain-containing protein 1 [Sesamum alatum]|uniref:Prolyl-tRNA synthetase associated domain-containing protein 1 n=1 Tax=Sesamum alatum TaxID=300844 RepID=A0AAE2CPE6_9LAMI|nr:Prolyl-tRNA synthetase associated domain-containing protein 1 [Sesamum alatum]
MGWTKEQLLARLQELQIDFSKYEHPVVLTVEAQAKYVGHMKGALSKNLFLKDKKQRYYIVSALPETKVDLKVLSQRLGLGKGGIRMAPEEALGEILQVPLGCVTPFALVNESARKVSLLLDQGFKNHECCFFHPLSNDTSIALHVRDLDKFLNSIGKTPAYVDLEANPAVGKDQPPDLATLVPSDATILADTPEKHGSSQGSEKNHISVNNQPTVVTVAKAVKPSTAYTKEKPPSAVNLSISYADPEKFVEEILEKTRTIVLAEVKEENIEKHREQLATMISNSISKQLGLELKNIATIFKNTAYTEGFKAGIHHQPKRL